MTYDEFIADYESNICQVIKRCKYNADGTALIYNLNTLPATSKILHGMNVITEDNENFIIPDTTVEMIYQEIDTLRAQVDYLSWIDAY